MSGLVSITGSFNSIKIKYVHIEMKPGLHGIGKVGVFLNEMEHEEFCRLGSDCPIQIKLEDKIVFSGIANELICEKRGYDYYEGEICLITKSILLDREKGEKSYQDISMSYKQVMESVADINTSENITNTIVYPILKFMETPWEFVKRMSSRYGYCVYPDYIGGTDSIFIGLPNDRKSVKINIADYSFGFLSSYLRKFKKIERDSFIFFNFQSNEYYKIGTEIELNGKKRYVYRIEGNYIGSELIFTYWIGKRDIVNVAPIYNYNIVGRTILGKVIETNGQTVKVHLDIDKEQDKDKAYPYPWSPDSGNLMYCMPQIGTRVSLYYGDTDEHPGKLIHCVRTNGSSTKHFNNSQEKHFTTEHNKNMVLYTDKIEFSNDARKNEKSHIWLTDNDCLEIKSDSIFDLIAKNKIQVKANSIKISAPLQINMIKPNQLVCAGSRKYTFYDAIQKGIELSNDLNMVADTRVAMAPKGYHVYPRINDKPTRIDQDRLKANVILGAMCVCAGVMLVLGSAFIATIAGVGAEGTAVAGTAVAGTAEGVSLIEKAGQLALSGCTLAVSSILDTIKGDLERGKVSSAKKYMFNGFGNIVIGALVLGISFKLGPDLLWEEGLTGSIQKVLLNGGLGVNQTIAISAGNGVTVGEDSLSSSFALTGISGLFPSGFTFDVAIFLNMLGTLDINNNGTTDDTDIGEVLNEILKKLNEKPKFAQ